MIMIGILAFVAGMMMGMLIMAIASVSGGDSDLDDEWRKIIKEMRDSQDDGK